jgi:putative ABC transport system ATP-binding protein
MSSVVLHKVSKDYFLGKTVVKALREVDITIEKGEFSVIAGPSGSGKTTVLNLIGCVDTATEGQVLVEGNDTACLSEPELTSLRLHTIGFIFQTFNLISVLNVWDNVEFPLLLMPGVSKQERRERTRHFIEMVGLQSHMHHRPNELSGGQRQRVAIARALVTKPKLVLADEPTANLDSETGQSIIDLLKSINANDGTTFIFSSHDSAVVSQARRVIRLHDGKVVGS